MTELARTRDVRLIPLLGGLAGLIAVGGVIHLTQGTAPVSAADVLRLAVG